MTRIITKALIGQQDISFGTGTFQRTTSVGGTITLNQVSGGAQLAAASDNSGQTADIASTTLVASAGSGMYRVVGYATITTPATTSSTMPEIIMSWTDADDGNVMTFDLTTMDTSNVTTAIQSGFLVMNCKVGTAITFSTSGYASTGATAMQFSVHIRVEGPL